MSKNPSASSTIKLSTRSTLRIPSATETASSVLKARKNPWKSATTALEYSGFSAKCGDVDFLAQAFNQYNDAFSDRVNNELGELQGRVHALENPDDPA